MKFDCPRWPPDWPEIADALFGMIESGAWGRYQSDRQEKLRIAIAEQTGVEFVRLCSSGTTAIETGLRIAGVGPGDEVILAAFDYPGNFRTIEVTGARPVLVDIDPRTLGPRCDQLEQAASDEVRAVIASHLYGNAADIGMLREQCDDRGWTLIEDACQAPGTMMEDRVAGSVGHVGTLSFGGSKPLTAGNGGAILTSDNHLAVKIQSLLDRPSDSNPLSSLQAAVLLPQLEKLVQCNELRVATARYLQTAVNPQLGSWQWLSELSDTVAPTHYKVAWAAKSLRHRAAIVDGAGELGLPIGEGFRAMARSSERRCRRPVSLETAERFGQTVFVLDHAALLVPQSRHQELGDFLLRLHDETNPG